MTPTIELWCLTKIQLPSYHRKKSSLLSNCPLQKLLPSLCLKAVRVSLDCPSQKCLCLKAVRVSLDCPSQKCLCLKAVRVSLDCPSQKRLYLKAVRVSLDCPSQKCLCLKAVRVSLDCPSQKCLCLKAVRVSLDCPSQKCLYLRMAEFELQSGWPTHFLKECCCHLWLPCRRPSRCLSLGCPWTSLHHRPVLHGVCCCCEGG